MSLSGQARVKPANQMRLNTTKLLTLLTAALLAAMPASGEVSKQVSSASEDGTSVTKLWSTSPADLAPKEWRARWIWRRGENEGSNLLLLARKQFSLEAKPEQARIFITADNFYELRVNGTLVNRGPTRCQPHQQSYDVLEIAPLLRAGENVLAMRALHQGSYGSFNLPPRPGLLAQLEIQSGGQRQLIVTDSTFKVASAEGVELDSENYPYQPNGSFSAGQDAEVNWLWQAARNTLDVVTTEAFTDNYRERLQYAQTSYYAARGSYAAYGDSFLQRRLLMQVALEQQSDGIMPASAPVFEHKGQRFLDASIFWLLGLHDYYLYSGDAPTTRRLLPAAEKILERFKTWENAEGFIDTPPYTYWIDHAALDRYGANFALNALYLLALQHCGRITGWLGDEAKTRQYEQRAGHLQQRMQTAFWDPTEKLFSDVRLDGKLAKKFTEQSNSLAIVTGVATADQQREIVREMIENRAQRLVPAVLFMHFVTEALFLAGQGEAAVTLLKDRYRHMKAAGSQTLWEDWAQAATFRTGRFAPIGHVAVSQAENTFVSYSLSKWLLGIRATQPGMAEIVITPNLGGLPEVRGRMPSPRGSIGVAWRRTGAGWILEAEVPEGVRCLLDLSSRDIEHKTLLIDGKAPAESSSQRNRIPVPNGQHTLELR